MVGTTRELSRVLMSLKYKVIDIDKTTILIRIWKNLRSGFHKLYNQNIFRRSQNEEETLSFSQRKVLSGVAAE